MGKNIVFITSSFPFGKSEVWAINEMSSSLELGNQITIIPRTGKGKIINQDAVKFASNLIDLPFLNWEIFIFLLRTIGFHPFIFFNLLISNIKQSNTLFDFIKGLIVIPKSLFLTKILVRKNIDHIHSLQTTSTAFMAHIISYVLKVPWSFTLHTSEIINSRYRRSFEFRSRSASICRTISKKTAEDLSYFLGPSFSKKVVLVPLGVKTRDFDNEIRAINDPFVIATPAELTSRKGHIYAIDAAKRLVDMGINNFKWFFYGSGPLFNKLQRKVKKLNLTNNIYLPGNLDHHHLFKKYENNKIDIVIIPSISSNVPEGIPVSLMEAMSFRIPVIASDCGGTKELVDGISGILVNEKDSKALSNAIVELIKKPDLRRKIAENGGNKVKQDFDTIKNTYDLIKLF
tara:strand:- start:9795 stop:11000 length:1206 start_codon:yes stop_codon:yes gene_type:complete